MDLSYAAAVRLGVDRTGTARVEIEALGPGSQPTRRDRNPESQQRTEPPPPAAVAASGGRRVQVGSFAERDNARRLAERLRDAGVDAVDIDRVGVHGRDLWRVRIGPVPAARVAELLERLRALGLPQARVFIE